MAGSNFSFFCATKQNTKSAAEMSECFAGRGDARERRQAGGLGVNRGGLPSAELRSLPERDAFKYHINVKDFVRSRAGAGVEGRVPEVEGGLVVLLFTAGSAARRRLHALAGVQREAAEVSQTPDRHRIDLFGEASAEIAIRVGVGHDGQGVRARTGGKQLGLKPQNRRT